jgi:hypothetical protein
MVGIVTKGGFTYRDCVEMPFDLYQHLLTEVPKEIQKAMKENRG